MAAEPIRKKRALIFPGFRIGTLTGMGKGLAAAFPGEAGAVFDEVDDILGFELSSLMFNGPEDKLKLLENRLPAVFALNMAIMRVLESRAKTLGVWKDLKDSIDGYVGHSFGEYAALCVAGSIDFKKTVQLMRDNGRSMDRDQRMQDGAMAIVFGTEKTPVIPSEFAKKIADEAALRATARTGKAQFCMVVNDNAPNQAVFSGHKEAIAEIKRIAIEQKLGVKAFNYGVPAHSQSFMGDAVKALRGFVRQLEVRRPTVPFISGCTAQVESNPARIRKLMSQNIAEPVIWQDTVRYMIDRGVTEFIECGDQLCMTIASIGERSASSLKIFALNTAESFDDFLRSLLPEPTAEMGHEAHARTGSGLGLAAKAAM